MPYNPLNPRNQRKDHPWLELKFELLNLFVEPNDAKKAIHSDIIKQLAESYGEARWLVQDLLTTHLIQRLSTGDLHCTDQGRAVLEAYKERSEYNRRRYYELNPNVE